MFNEHLISLISLTLCQYQTCSFLKMAYYRGNAVDVHDLNIFIFDLYRVARILLRYVLSFKITLAMQT